MPYCTIEEAWGISLSDNSPINPKVGTNTVVENDRTSRNYKKLEKTNGTNRYLRNKGELNINLDEQPIVNKSIEDNTSYELCNPKVESEENFTIDKREKNNNKKENIEHFNNEQINRLLEENMRLKELLNKDNNNNQELILFIVLGIVLIYLFNLFIRMGNK